MNTDYQKTVKITNNSKLKLNYTLNYASLFLSQIVSEQLNDAEHVERSIIKISELKSESEGICLIKLL